MMPTAFQIVNREKKFVEQSRHLSRPLRLALVCDYAEEGWRSMDLFGNMLTTQFREHHAGEIAPEQLRPRWRARLSRIPLAGAAGLSRNADRLLNRFHDYPRWLRKQAAGFDLFHLIDHSYSQLVHELPAERTVVTCHDLDTFRCLLEPDVDPRPRWFRAMARRSLSGFERCAHVIAVSEATRAQLLQHGVCSSEQITVIPPGVDPAYFAPANYPPRTDRPRSEPGPYLLHVGSTIRRKRIDVLLRVFAEIRKDFPEIQLVRVGGELTAEQSELAAALDVDRGLVQKPSLSAAELASLYGGDAILLQTSDAEGFGLPVIESMASGCPVIASDIQPLREAGGDAAEYCAVADVAAWSGTLTRLLRERAESPDDWRARRERAQRHAQRFSWRRNAEQTVEVYRKVLERAG